MDVTPAIDEEFDTFTTTATVAKLRGAFGDPALRAVLITNDDELDGIVTRRDVISSQESPSRKAKTLARPVPRISPDEDVREAARLMLTGDTPVLPVFEDGDLVAILREEDLLELVRDSLDAIEATDVATTDLIFIDEDASLGRTLADFREEHIRHFPVTDDEGQVVGIVSLHDVLEFVSRQMDRSQGGRPARSMGAAVGGHHGGFGAREGERADMLSLPVRDVMAEPVVSVDPGQPVDEIVGAMLEHNTSSVILEEDGRPTGIITKTDILESLTWEDDQPYYVHVLGSDNMVELGWENLSDRIERVIRKDASLRLLEAKVHFHHHKENLRGRPLVLCRVRLFTDDGMLVGSGEGYGDRHAFSLALDVIERQLLDEKRPTRAERSREHLRISEWKPDEDPTT